MADIAKVGIEVDGVKDIDQAEESLDNLADAADRADDGLEDLGKTSKKTGDKVDRFAKKASLGERQLKSLRGAAKRVTSELKGVALALGAAFAGREIIATLAQFDTAMSKAGAISRATADELKAMRDIAKDLGATTEFSAKQAADGLTFLSMAGFSASEGIAAIPAVLDLATAAALDLGQAADTASNIMSAFNISADQAGSVADILAAASSRANTNVNQLGGAMSTVGPIAAALNINMSDTAAAIGVMSDAGIQGERAGTALRGVLASLAGPTKQARDALAKYGLTAKDVDPNVRSLSDIMDTLGERGLSTADAMTIFGREAASGALVLVKGSELLREFGGELRKVDGEAKRMAETMRDNLGGDLDSLYSSIQGAIIAIGESGLTAVIRTAVQAITEAFRLVTKVFTDFRGYIIAAAAVITAAYIPAIYAAIKGTALWIAGLVTLKGLLITTGIGALVVAVGTLINEFIKLSEKLGSTGAAFKLLGDVAAGVWEGIKTSAQAIPPALQAVWETVKANFLEMIADLTQAWADFMSNFTGVIDVIPGMRGMGGLMQGAINSAASNLDSLRASADAARESAAALNAESSNLASNGFQEAANAAQRLMDVIGGSTSGGPSTRGGKRGKTGDSTDTDTTTTPSGGGGGGESGGGLLSRFQSLREELSTQAEQAKMWYEQGQEALNWALENERLTTEEHKNYMLELEQRYQDKLRAIRNQNQSKQVGEFSDFLGSLQSIAQQGGDRMTKIAAVIGAAQALINTYLAASQAMADPTLGFFGKLAAVASVIATGMGLVNAIRSAGSSGGGNRSSTSVGRGSSAPSSASGVSSAPAQPEKRVLIDLHGDDWIRNLVEPIISKIYEETRDGAKVVFTR